MRSLDAFADRDAAGLLPVEKCWQPADFLPDFRAPTWVDEVRAYRDAAAALPDELLVTLIANMITEEALPSYHAWLANLETGFDRSGVSSTGMARWIRGWVAEEKRHGDVLAAYLNISGRVDMRCVSLTTQHLLRNGFDPLTENDVIQGFIYTSFQERATYISHSGVAKLARRAGDERLARICENIAGDEVRHERAYERFVGHLFALAPDDTMLAFAAMLRKSIVMPSRTMQDGAGGGDLYQWFAAITQRSGIYTTLDYAQIMAHLVRIWAVGEIEVSSDAAKAAQDYLVHLPARYLKMATRAEGRGKCQPRPVGWLGGRLVG